MATHVVTTWLHDQAATSPWGKLFRRTLRGDLSNARAAEKIRQMMEEHPAFGIPWVVCVHLRNPELVDWKEVSRVIAS